SQHLASRAAQTPVDGLIHPPVLPHKAPPPPVLEQPAQRPVIRPRVLNDMLDLHLLVRHGSNAQLEPGGTAVARCHNRESHPPIMLPKPAPVDRESKPRSAGFSRQPSGNRSVERDQSLSAA